MKNLHLLPTDNKPSRLYFNVNDKEFQICEIEKPSTILKPNRHIYITSDEEIKEGDWCYQVELNDVRVDKCYDVTLYHTWTNNGVDKTRKFKNIILTTDQDLIKDGVQAIDDEFLEWFVKNPSCEEAEVQKWFDGVDFLEYKIIIPKEIDVLELGQIIPKEEPKQETLEEAVDKASLLEFPIKEWYRSDDYNREEITAARDGFKRGAKWQQERSYSEEDMKLAFEAGHKKGFSGYPNTENWKELPFKEWFEQFKNK